MSTAYHVGYTWPFPQLTVWLRVGDERHGPCMALVDSGADATLIPTHWLLEWDAVEGDPARIRSHCGEYQWVQRYMLDIQVEGLWLSGIYTVGNEVDEEIILGRDVLNKLPIFLTAHSSKLKCWMMSTLGVCVNSVRGVKRP